MPIVVPQLGIPGTLVYEWIDPANVTRALSGNATVNVKVGQRGLGLPDVGLNEEKLPYAAGTQVRHASIASRRIDLPILFQAASSSSLEQLMDSVYSWFATASEETRTPGYLRITRADGTQRQIACYYDGGLEGDLAFPRAGDVWQEATVRLLAADPWATDVADTVHTWTAAQLPNQTIINTGQLDAFPIWTITGPVNLGQIFANTTTGLSFQINVAISSGGLSTHVDTRPASQRSNLAVYRDDGLALFRYIEPGSVLWTLVPGQNNLAITLAGTSGVTSIELRYRARYRGLHR